MSSFLIGLSCVALLIVVAVLGGPVLGFISPEDKNSIIGFITGTLSGGIGTFLYMNKNPKEIVEEE